MSFACYSRIHAFFTPDTPVRSRGQVSAAHHHQAGFLYFHQFQEKIWIRERSAAQSDVSVTWIVEEKPRGDRPIGTHVWKTRVLGGISFQAICTPMISLKDHSPRFHLSLAPNFQVVVTYPPPSWCCICYISTSLHPWEYVTRGPTITPEITESACSSSSNCVCSSSHHIPLKTQWQWAQSRPTCRFSTCD